MADAVQEVEQILVIPTSLFHEIGYFQGFQEEDGASLAKLLDPEQISYRPRPEMEQDPSFKQLIPYCLFTCGGKYFFYTRGKAGGEARLKSKRSIGVGGHISSADVGKTDHPYQEGMKRELEEEVSTARVISNKLVGLINDDLTEVGKVHLGVVHVIEIEEPRIEPREASMQLPGFATIAELVEQREEFETWSQICIDYLALQR
jgi:predicted NUDIX family phosphoesterase